MMKGKGGGNHPKGKRRGRLLIPLSEGREKGGGRTQAVNPFHALGKKKKPDKKKEKKGRSCWQALRIEKRKGKRGGERGG